MLQGLSCIKWPLKRIKYVTLRTKDATDIRFFGNYFCLPPKYMNDLADIKSVGGYFVCCGLSNLKIVTISSIHYQDVFLCI